MGVGGALVVEGADGFEAIDEGEGRVFGGGFDVGVAGGGDDEGLLVADDGVEEGEGETSAVESSQTGLPSMWARVMAWLKEPGEGTSGLKVMPAPMRTASA